MTFKAALTSTEQTTETTVSLDDIESYNSSSSDSRLDDFLFAFEDSDELVKLVASLSRLAINESFTSEFTDELCDVSDDYQVTVVYTRID